ncbi:MAG: recombination protein O N-terminal domain-containing protein [Porphyromonas sp.]|nr:recombination protein O N-terminal domain-containing protein [Porphyromonas sp.]
MLIETEVLVLKGVRYSDTHSIVHTYSEDFGTLSFRVSHANSRRRRGGMRAFFIPLSLLRVSLDYRQNNDIHLPREVSIVHAPLRPTIDPHANAIALLITEVLSRVLRIHQSDTQLYNFIRGEVLRLETVSTAELPAFHLALLSGLCLHLGVMPSTEGYQEGYILQPQEGRFTPPISAEEHRRIPASALFYQFITSPTPELLPLNRHQRNDLLALLLHYLAHYYPSLEHLRSPDVLKRLFVD